MARLLVIVLALMLGVTGAWGDPLSECSNTFDHPPDHRIHVCTQLIEGAKDLSIRERAAAYYSRGVAYTEKGDFGSAIADHNKYVELNPLEGDPETPPCRIYARPPGDVRIRCWTQFIEGREGWSKSWTAYAYNSRGGEYDKTGDYDRAIADYTKALELKGAYEDTIIARGVVYKRQGEYDRAITDFYDFVLMDPSNFTPLYHRGLAYRAKGDDDRAAADFEKAAELEQADIEEYFVARGSFYAVKGEYEKAFAEFKKVIDQFPKEAMLAYRDRGWTYARKGEITQAKKDFDKAKKLEPVIWLPKLPPLDTDAQKL